MLLFYLILFIKEDLNLNSYHPNKIKTPTSFLKNNSTSETDYHNNVYASTPFCMNHK